MINYTILQFHIDVKKLIPKLIGAVLAEESKKL